MDEFGNRAEHKGYHAFDTQPFRSAIVTMATAIVTLAIVGLAFVAVDVAIAKPDPV